MSSSTLNILMVAQVIISIFMIASILIQNRTEGMGTMFGGGGGEVFRTKRGVEKLLYYTTIFLAIAFAVLSFIIVKYT